MQKNVTATRAKIAPTRKNVLIAAAQFAKIYQKEKSMADFNEKYFASGNGESRPDKVEDVLLDGEQITWRGKPKKSAYIANSVAKMFPIALIWIIFDGFFIGMMATNGFDIPTPLIVFMSVFFVLHLAPVWIWIYKAVTARKRHENLEYVFTDKRIIIRSGVVAVNFDAIDYKDVAAVNVRYGVIDKIAKVGDIYVTAAKKATVIEDLNNPREVSKILQSLVSKVKTGVSFTEGVKVEMVKCKYCGTKNRSTDKTCSSCGAPLD